MKKHLKENKYDIIIAVDKGLEILCKIKIKPNYLIGDFDSLNLKYLKKYEKSNIQIRRLIPEKDLTDTHFALNLAIEINSTNITIIGAIGSRIDHTLANIHILNEALNKNIEARIIDENNEIELINNAIQIKKNDLFKYISIIPLTTNARGITIKGMKYSIEDYTLEMGTSLGISNEQIDKISEIEIKQGTLIIIKSRD